MSQTQNPQGENTHPLLSSMPPDKVKKGKVVSAREAVSIIREGDVIATGGFVGTGFPEYLAIELENRFLETGYPRNLTLTYAAGQGDGKVRGLNHLGHEGLLKRVIGGHWGLVPALQKLALDNKIEAYNLPQGVLSHMYRDIAADKPRTVSEVGLGTFVDPRHEGGKINQRTVEDLVELISFDGREYLAYKTFPLNVAILRGTTADTEGNVSMEKEALVLENLCLAQAAKNSGGFVIVQVERIAQEGSLPARDVVVPGVMVDCVVVSEPEHHWQTFGSYYDPSFSGEIRVPLHTIPEMEMSPRKVIARRGAFELRPNSVVNLGIGMPEGVANIANEERILDLINLTAEPGVIGGIPSGGLNFGAAVNIHSLVSQPEQFDFYDGGGLDVAFLGLAQADGKGNVNVSRFGNTLAGAGGFINISQKTKRVVFVGTFTSGGLRVEIKDGQLKILQEGKYGKFLSRVEQITYSGEFGLLKNQYILYVTERCVFLLTRDGLQLIEIAPGIEIERDVIAHMGFRPGISQDLSYMEDRIFTESSMGLKDDLLPLSLQERLTLDPNQDLFFVNFEGISIKTAQDIKEIENRVTRILAPLGRKVYTIVNYDDFSINQDILDEYTDMIKRLVDRFYKGVTRYTTSTFLRSKLGDALKKRNQSPHIYETREEAQSKLGW